MTLFETLKKLLRDILGVFNIEDTVFSLVRMLSGETPIMRLTDASDCGTSVDPEPLLYTPALESAELMTGLRGSSTLSLGHGAEDGSRGQQSRNDSDAVSVAIESSMKEALHLSKATRCTSTLSGDNFTAAKTSDSDCDFAESGENDDVDDAAEKEGTSTKKLEEKLLRLKRQATSHRTAAWSTVKNYGSTQQKPKGAEDGWALYAICPQLAPGAPAAPAPKHAGLGGRVTFDAPLFSEGDFEIRVSNEKVCLEFVLIDPQEIHGYIRVLNTTYVKNVTVDYTENTWEMVNTRSADWVETVHDGRMDRFKFSIPGRQSKGNLMFSLRFNGALDDNKGHNYIVSYEQ